MRDAVLVLQSGKCFFGRLVGKKSRCIGEVCFTTGITGYQHTITDPSFADQIIVFTFPHVGNIGVNYKDNEAEKIFASGVVVRECAFASHISSYITLDHWLEKNGTTGITGVDTRALTKYLRKHGSQNGVICSASEMHSVLDELEKYKFVDGIEIINKVSLHGTFKDCGVEPKHRIIIVDFGVKASIVACLMELGCSVNLIKPVKEFAQKILELKPDGIVLSNGPGDPKKIAQDLIGEINAVIKSGVPVFGICMGHQLLAIALGARTVKMDNGHRGSNHPVYAVKRGQIEVTSQNHGFVVDQNSLPDNVEITHISLFDNSIEGIMLKDFPVFSVQYHPEEAPGTSDSNYLFESFIENVKLYKNQVT